MRGDSRCVGRSLACSGSSWPLSNQSLVAFASETVAPKGSHCHCVVLIHLPRHPVLPTSQWFHLRHPPRSVIPYQKRKARGEKMRGRGVEWRLLVDISLLCHTPMIRYVLPLQPALLPIATPIFNVGSSSFFLLSTN